MGLAVGMTRDGLRNDKFLLKRETRRWIIQMLILRDTHEPQFPIITMIESETYPVNIEVDEHSVRNFYASYSCLFC